MERSRTTGSRSAGWWLFVYFATQRCPSKSLSFARFSYANAQGRQNHGRTESCREKDQRQSSMILSGHDSVVSGCGFAALLISWFTRLNLLHKQMPFGQSRPSPKSNVQSLKAELRCAKL